MSLVLFSICLFIIFLFFAVKKKKPLFVFICCVYISSFLGTIILNLFEKQLDILIFPTVYLHIILLMWILPFSRIDGFKKDIISETKLRRIKLIVKLLGFLGVVTLFYFSFFAIKLFLNFDLSIARDLIREETILPLGFVSLFFISVSTIYYIYIYIYFISIVYDFSSISRNMVLIGSLSYPAMVLCFFGRDGLLYWGMNFVVMYLYFKKVLSTNICHKINKILLVLGSFSAVIFLLISVSRFQDSSLGVLESLFSYLGQQYQNFSDGFYLKSQSSSLVPTFNTLLQKIGLIDRVDPEEHSLIEKIIRGDEYNVFSYFIGSFVIKIGVWRTFFLSLFFCFFLNYIGFQYVKERKMEYFLVLYTIFQIPMCGVFYYRQGVSYMDIGYLYTLLLYIYIKYRIRYRSNCI